LVTLGPDGDVLCDTLCEVLLDELGDGAKLTVWIACDTAEAA
jgi:hypothetical protein